MEENKGSAFKDGEYREFCWHWCLVSCSTRRRAIRTETTQRDYGRENKNERSNQVLQRL